MPTTVFNATTIRGFTTVWKSWSNGKAYQGQLSGKDCGGEIYFNFSALSPLSNISITNINLSFHAADDGGSYDKYLYLRLGSFNSSSGTKVGDHLYSSLRNTNKSISYSDTSNPNDFNRLKNFILGGGSVLYLYGGSTRGKSSSKSYDYDYASITSMSLEITYTYLKSDGTITDSQTGSASILTIAPYDNTYSHKVTWSLGSNSYGPQTIAAGTTTASYTIPHTWLPDSTSGVASVELETIDSGGNSLGTNTYTFNLSVPSSIVPTIGSFTITPVNNGASAAAAAWGLYIQGKTKATATIANASAGSGATGITSYSITTSPGFGSGTTSSLTTNNLTASGNVVFTAVVTDSRGRTATSSQTITVQPYTPPSFTSTPIGFRSDSQGNQEEINGTYASITATFTYASVNNNNALTSTVTILSVETAITSGTAVVIGSGSLTSDLAYTASIKLKDTVGTETIYDVIIPSAEYLIHFAAGGKSIGIGKAASGNDKKVHVGWEMVLDHPLDPASGGTGQTTLQATRNAMGLGDTTGALPVANGGTGQTSLQATRNAMGLGDTTGALPVGNGGTGASTAVGARNNIGAACGLYDTSNEIDTGNDWIDDKRIYRRVCTSTTLAKTHTFNSSSWNMDRPIHIYGTVSFTDNGNVYWIPIVDAEGSNYSVSVSYVNDTFSVWSSYRSFTNVALVIEYTKAAT